MNKPEFDPKEKVPVIMGPAFLKKHEEKEHYSLWRPIFVERTDDATKQKFREQCGELGPLMVLREVREGEKVDLESFHPIEKRPLRLMVVWDPRKDQNV